MRSVGEQSAMEINGPPSRLLLAVARREAAERDAALKERLAELEKRLAERDISAVASEGGKNRGSRRPWAPFAAPIARPMLTSGAKKSDIIKELRKQFREHPKWPGLPGNDKPFYTWFRQGMPDT
jgi:hypothetical protein